MRQAKWRDTFGMQEDEVKPHTRVCSRHFADGNPQNDPDAHIGKRFTSPFKKTASRTTRAKVREKSKEIKELLSAYTTSPGPKRSSITSGQSCGTTDTSLPTDVDCIPESSTPCGTPIEPPVETPLLSVALSAKIEALEAENARLQDLLRRSTKQEVPFGMKYIMDDDKLVSFYTGFVSYRIFLAFYQFLGPAVDNLVYWGGKGEPAKRKRGTKLPPQDQLLMTLMKLKLNLTTVDLANRFCVSSSTVTNYVTTWICFLYHHLKEIDWMPAVAQIQGTLPPVFRERYPTTYAIVDCSEIFLETPSDLHLQSSTWSNYKHHNTAKFLIAVTPNGCVSYVSPLYVGSISDVELTSVSGFLDKLEENLESPLWPIVVSQSRTSCSA